MNDNPHSSPTSDLAAQQGASLTPRKTGFPFTLVLRWALSLIAVSIGIAELFFYLKNWASLIAYPTNHPLLSVALAVIHILGGVMLFKQSKWIISLFLVHFAAYIVKFLLAAGFTKPPLVLVIYLTIDALTLWLCLHLWAHKRLK